MSNLSGHTRQGSNSKLNTFYKTKQSWQYFEKPLEIKVESDPFIDEARRKK